ncbi:hypothetical protein [Lactococcus formosensis]|uniref:Uncharacterized protein n=1 Tax=Lactococcus formosensis TaxID=1281486 RepID=A0A9Q8Y040_9LACT|nr:hypothetical protein [Lactococcus formosensis]UKS68412.1 hypothetical protein G8766_04155 [Lactococcus garvieae]USJ19562.1 hypothetical protein LMK00_06915 [Lactococcus formosensis]
MNDFKMKHIEEFENKNFPLGQIFKEKLMSESLLTVQGKLRDMELMPSITRYEVD